MIEQTGEWGSIGQVEGSAISKEGAEPGLHPRVWATPAAAGVNTSLNTCVKEGVRTRTIDDGHSYSMGSVSSATLMAHMRPQQIPGLLACVTSLPVSGECTKQGQALQLRKGLPGPRGLTVLH